MDNLEAMTFPMRSAMIQSLDGWRRANTADRREMMVPVIAAIDDAVTYHSLDRTVAVAQAAWNAGTGVPTDLKLIVAGMLEWIATNGIYDLGKDGTADRMRQALLREVGIPGEWPTPDQDPPRGVTPTDPIADGPLPERPAPVN